MATKEVIFKCRRFVLPTLIAFLSGMAVSAEPRTLSVTLTGQSAIQADIRVETPSASLAIAPLLKGDVIFTNFEATIAEEGQPGAGFHAPPEALDALMALGFNLLSLSNNHSWDMQLPGLQNTLREVSLRNLAHAGIGATIDEAAAPGYLRTPNGTVGLVAMASGLIVPEGSATTTRPGVNELRVEDGNKPNKEDARRILQSIRDAAKQADLVIAYQHNHVFDKDFFTIFNEELPERLVPPAWIKHWAHREIDAGADIVVLHGAPLVHGVEIYHKRPIFYDMGNFIFQLPPTRTMLEEPIIWESVIAYVEFHGKNLRSIKFRAIELNKLGHGNRSNDDLFMKTRGLPTPVTIEKAYYILKRLAESSRPFGTVVEVKGDTAEIKMAP
jgi:poly-gamma-glutamate synthesis protein (capsule biosynthesis protein)